jgi:hypothetical protein
VSDSANSTLSRVSLLDDSGAAAAASSADGTCGGMLSQFVSNENAVRQAEHRDQGVTPKARHWRPVLGSRYHLGGIGTPLSPAGLGPERVPASASVGTPSDGGGEESSGGRLSDGAWRANPVFGEATAQRVAAQLAFDSPLLTARGGALLRA